MTLALATLALGLVLFVLFFGLVDGVRPALRHL